MHSEVKNTIIEARFSADDQRNFVSSEVAFDAIRRKGLDPAKPLIQYVDHVSGELVFAQEV